MRMSTRLGSIVGGVCMLVAAAAGADEKAKPMGQDDNRPKLFTLVGTSVTMGGGFTGFTDSKTRDYADVGGEWDFRVVVGTRRTLAVEAAYTGNAADITALGLDRSAALISTGVEAAVRVNLAMADWQPYVVAGAGWRRYDLTGADFNTSSVAGEDNVLEIPIGAGVSYRYRGFVGDARATLRPSFDNDLIAGPTGSPRPTLHNWTASLMGGWEF